MSPPPLACPRRPFPALALLLYDGGTHGEGSLLLVGGGVHRPAQPRGHRRGQGWRGGACPISRCVLLPPLMRVAGWSCAPVTSGLVELLPRAASRAREVARGPCRAQLLRCGWHAGMLLCCINVPRQRPPTRDREYASTWWHQVWRARVRALRSPRARLRACDRGWPDGGEIVQAEGAGE
jgi:hypothetical protein